MDCTRMKLARTVSWAIRSASGCPWNRRARPSAWTRATASEQRRLAFHQVSLYAEEKVEEIALACFPAAVTSP